jgi:tetratricopeptide (TPR) repeat protein
LTPTGLVGALTMPLSLPLAFLLAGIPGMVGALTTLIPSVVMSWISQKVKHKGQDRKISSSLRCPRSTLSTPPSLPPSAQDINRASRLTSQGMEAFKVGSYNEALHYFDESIKLNPSDALALNNKGYLLYKLHRPDEALAYVEMAIEANPRFEMAWRNKFGMTLKMEGPRGNAQIIREACQALGISEKELLAKWEHGQECEDP